MQFDDKFFEVDYGLEAYIKHPEFWRQHAVRTYARLMSPKISRPEDITLPKVSIIHYMPENVASLGIDKSHSLMRNVGDRVYVHHIDDMVMKHGSVREVPAQLEQYKKQYQKKYRSYIRVRNLDTALVNDKLHMVVNYSLLQKKYKYIKNRMLIHDEWANMRDTLWKTVGDMGELRFQFIPVYLPKHLPTRMMFQRYSNEFPTQAIKEFHEVEALDILDMWRIAEQAIVPVDPDKGGRVHPALQLSTAIQGRTYFAFIENNNVVFVKLVDFISWAKEKEAQFQKDFYKFLDSLISTRFDSEISVDEEGDEEEDKTTDSDTLDVESGDEDGIDYNEDEKELEELIQEREEEIIDSVDDVTDLGDDEDVIKDDVSLIDENDSSTLLIDKAAPVKDMGLSHIDQKIKERGELGMLSAAEQKALRNMSERFLSMPSPISDKPLVEDLVIDPSTLKVKDEAMREPGVNTLDESYLHSRTLEFQKRYSSEVYEKDILNVCMAPQAGGVIVKSIKRKEITNAVTNKITYSVQVQPIGAKATTLTFTIPKIDEDGTFTTGGVQYYMVMQKGDAPILKIKPHTVALSSYYGKAFVIRNQNAATNYERWILKHLTTRGMDGNDETVTNLSRGISRFEGDKLPRVYTAIAGTIHGFDTGGYNFIFDYENLEKHFPEKVLSKMTSNKLVPCGFGGSNALGMDKDGMIHKLSGDKVVLLGSLPSIIDPGMGEGPMEYAELGIFSKRIPVILVLAYLYGLDRILKAYKIKYRVVGVNERIVVDSDHYRVKFKDESYIIDISKPEHKLLIAGFNSVRKKLTRYRSNDFNKRAIYLSLLSGSGITQSHLRELVLMNDMFIDHITLGELERMKEPTTFEGLLVRANELLIDDYTPPFEEYRIKGYERIAGMAYKQMVNSIRSFRSRGNNPNAELTMNPQAVWLDILSDQTKSMVEDINPIHSLKERETVTFSGAGGRSEISMTKLARGFKENDLGVFSEASPDSSKVAIRTYMAPDSNVTDLRGNVIVKKPKDIKAVNTLSTSALVSVGATHDD